MAGLQSTKDPGTRGPDPRQIGTAMHSRILPSIARSISLAAVYGVSLDTNHVAEALMNFPEPSTAAEFADIPLAVAN